MLVTLSENSCPPSIRKHKLFRGSPETRTWERWVVFGWCIQMCVCDQTKGYVTFINLLEEVYLNEYNSISQPCYFYLCCSQDQCIASKQSPRLTKCHQRTKCQKCPRQAWSRNQKMVRQVQTRTCLLLREILLLNFLLCLTLLTCVACSLVWKRWD